MRTVAFVSQNGGSGKSTIASSLAVAAHEMREKVCVVDMDPQGSLMRWAKIRAAGDIEVLASGAARLPALLGSLKRRGVTLALLDTPGAEGAASTAAMQAADLNIVPSRLSLFDLWASARTRTALEAIDARFVFLLNQCPPACTMTFDKILKSIITTAQEWFCHSLFAPSNNFNDFNHGCIFGRILFLMSLRHGRGESLVLSNLYFEYKVCAGNFLASISAFIQKHYCVKQFSDQPS